ncbi:MAG: ABC transporter permease [Myxococcota bacterium]
MQGVLAIAANTILEGRRQKVFYAIFFFAIAMILFGVAMSGMATIEYDRILRNVGAGAISFFGVLMAIFLGVGMVSREVDRRTVYTVVTKPVPRWAFIAGKFLGLMGILTVTLSIMFLCHLAVLFSFADEMVLAPLALHLLMTLLMLAIVVAFAILMSTFSSSPMAAFCTVALYLIGTASSSLHFFGQRSDSAFVQSLSTAIYYGLPNMERFNLTEAVTHGTAVEAGMVGLASLHALAFSTAFLAVAILIFERRDLK